MKKKRTIKKIGSDWARLDAMKDEDIDYSDIPPLEADFFENAIPFDKLFPKAQPKEPITMRLDPDLVRWYKRGGRGYQTRINFALRKFMMDHRPHDAGRKTRATKSKGGKVPK